MSWQRVRAVFTAALDAAPAARDALVAESCADDPEVAREVAALLQAHAAAHGFLDTDASPPDVVDVDPIGRCVGPYRILGEIGHGGMGTVYRARREDALYLRDVALKLVPGPLASHLLGDRFRRERAILGRLEHPNIARLLDGGTADDGRPWFAMELVEGLAIDEHCERLDLRRRIELFRVVCGAVAFAHRNLVVHRDLKARNVLVTPDGTPKLLDFGIAKLLAPEDSDPTGLTSTGMRPMTPECASPEQVAGGPVTTATDVYALGVMLYQLVSGRPPYTFANRSAEEMVRVVCRQEPAPPSRALAPGHELWASRQKVAGDLDTIVLEALRKQPERRYASADELSEDLRRFLDGEPVRARKDSLGYRARKFVGRHRGGVLAAALVVASLLAGLGAALHQARLAGLSRERADKRSQDARRLANSLVFELHDAIADVPGTTRARALVLQRAGEMLDTLSADAPDDPVLAEDLATAYHRLGDVLGDTAGGADLGEAEAALSAHRKGLVLRAGLAAAAPGDAARQRALAESEVETSYALHGTAAISQARQAVERTERLRTATPGGEAEARLLGKAFCALGAAQVAEGDLAAATESFERFAAVAEAELAARPEDAQAAQHVTLAHRRLGAILAKQGRFREALAHYREALPIDEARVARNPDSVEARMALSVSLVDLGWALRASGDPHGAIEQYERALAIREALLAADPANAQARRGVGSVLERLGGTWNTTGDPMRALAYLERTRRVLVDERPDPELWASLHVSLSEVQGARHRFGEALANARIARASYARLLANDPGGVWFKTGLARSSLRAGDALLGLAAQARAEPAAQDRYRREASSAYADALRLMTGLQAAGLLAAGDAALLDEAAASLRRSSPTPPTTVATR